MTPAAMTPEQGAVVCTNCGHACRDHWIANCVDGFSRSKAVMVCPTSVFHSVAPMAFALDIDHTPTYFAGWPYEAQPS